MKNLAKLGYMLVGAGLGVFITTLVFEYELNKPIGEIEEYIPKDSQDGSENDISTNNSNDENTVVESFTKNDAHILDFYKSNQDDLMGVKDLEQRAKDRRAELEKSRANRNQTTRYSKMYEDELSVEEKLQAQSDAHKEWANRQQEKMQKTREDEYLDYITHSESQDYPSDDEMYEDDILDSDTDLVRERVENNFEIYLGENPQDFIPLIFYEGDNTLADDKEHVVPAADEVVGLVALSRLIEGGPGAEEGVIYVRNLKTNFNYEVVLDAGSYSETVLGIFNSRQNGGSVGDVNRR